jgi:hypothetical protein
MADKSLEAKGAQILVPSSCIKHVPAVTGGPIITGKLGTSFPCVLLLGSGSTSYDTRPCKQDPSIPTKCTKNVYLPVHRAVEALSSRFRLLTCHVAFILHRFLGRRKPSPSSLVMKARTTKLLSKISALGCVFDGAVSFSTCRT